MKKWCMYVFLWALVQVFFDICFNKYMHEKDGFGTLSFIFFYYSYL